MRRSLYNSLYTNPKTLTYAMERALTLMNTTSYQEIMEGCAIIGLGLRDVEYYDEEQYTGSE